MLKERAKILRSLIMAFDLGVVLGSFFLTYALRVVFRGWQPLDKYLWLLPILLIIWGYLLFRGGMYKSFRTREISDLLYIVFKSAFVGLLILSGAMYFLKIHSISRTFVSTVFLVTTCIFCIEKASLIFVFRHLRKKGYNFRNILIIGSNKRAENFIDIVNENSEWGLRIVGIIDEDGSRVGQEIKGIKIIGTFNDVENILHSTVIDEAVFIVPHSWLDKIKDLISLFEIQGITVDIAADFFELKIAKARQADLQGFPLLTFETTSTQYWQLFIKRSLDFFVSAVGLLILSPFLAVIALIIKLTSPGPIFFRQERSGLNGRKFMLYKFRTMVADAESKLEDLKAYNEMKGPVFKMQNDPRITPIGRFLRKFSLDEVPQLWNVFTGDMSLVGPRPPLPAEVNQYDNWHRRRLSMRPGITCLWQVKGRNKISDFDEWMKLDLEYIDNWSLSLDFQILFMTIPVVLFGIGAK